MMELLDIAFLQKCQKQGRRAFNILNSAKSCGDSKVARNHNEL